MLGQGKFLLFSDGFIIQYFFPDYKSEITVCNYKLYNHYPPAKWEKMAKNRVKKGTREMRKV